MDGEGGTDGNGFKDGEGIPVYLGDYLEGASRRANEMQGCGVGETSTVQIPRGQPDAWVEVLEAVDTRSGIWNRTREMMRLSNVTTVGIERTGCLALGVLAEEPDAVPVGDEFLVDVVGEVEALVDDHADAGWRQPGGGSAVLCARVGGDGRTRCVHRWWHMCRLHRSGLGLIFGWGCRRCLQR